MATYGNRQQRDELKAALQSVEAFELPDSIQTAISNSNVNASLDPALIQRYKDLRATFIQRNVQNSFLEYASTFDGEGEFDKVDGVPTEEQEEELEQRIAQVRGEVTQASEGMHRQVLELQQKHSTFCLRREELRKMVQDMDDEDAERQTLDETTNTIVVDDDSDAEEMEDDALAKEEKRLTILQERKAKLEMELHRLRHETSTLRISAEQTEAKVVDMLGTTGQEQPPSPTALQAETAETQKKLQELREIQSFYDGLREVMEELTGIQILSVTRATTNKESEDDSTMAPPAADPKDMDVNDSRAIHMHVRVLQDHEIQITLRSDPETPQELRVAEAKFLTPTVVRQAVDDTIGEKCRDGTNGNDNKVLKLTIPPLDDLVRLCARFPPAEELRFLIREAMARIRMIQNRVVELAILHNNVLTKIGGFHHTNDGFGTEEQEVVCSLNECISVVLRLTADCPVVPGSVYIYNMVGVAGWDDETVNKIKGRVSKKEFQSPLALIQDVQAEIGRLQDEEGYSLPKTPILPLRRKKN